LVLLVCNDAIWQPWFQTDAEDQFSDVSDIPTKMAELAKSGHGGDIFGDLGSILLNSVSAETFYG
jgi:hypothetical protein